MISHTVRGAANQFHNQYGVLPYSNNISYITNLQISLLTASVEELDSAKLQLHVLTVYPRFKVYIRLQLIPCTCNVLKLINPCRLLTFSVVVLVHRQSQENWMAQLTAT